MATPITSPADSSPVDNQQLSIQDRILQPVRLLVFRTLLGIGVASIIGAALLTKSGLDTKMKSMADFLEKTSSSYIANFDIPSLDGFAKQALQDGDIVYVRISDEKGKVLAEANEGSSFESPELARTVLDQGTGKVIGEAKVGYSRKRIYLAVLATILLMVGVFYGVLHLLTRSIKGLVEEIIQPLNAVTTKIDTSACSVTDNSTELNETSQRLRDEVSKLSAAVFETNASTTQITSMIAQTTANAESSAEATSQINQKTRNGQAIMDSLAVAMESIHGTTEQVKDIAQIITKISEKTQIINSIVFQTKLLSFNASIEAARAGEHGAGFAVVAQEVGNLAQMSGHSANEIDNLLKSSEESVAKILEKIKERVGEGKEVSDRALGAFKEIARDVSAISDQIESIHVAAKEQQEGVKQVSQAMHGLEGIINSNEEIARKLTESAGKLSGQSQQISEIAGEVQTLVLGEARPKT